MNALKLANPITATKGAWGLASTTLGLAGAVAGRSAQLVMTLVARSADDPAAPTRHAPGDDDADSTTAVASETAKPTGADPRRALPGPDVVGVEPQAPTEPPVDVVGAALAAESAADRGQGRSGAGLAHEPRGASRDEEHGDAWLQRAEVDEIAEEVSAALDTARG